MTKRKTLSLVVCCIFAYSFLYANLTKQVLNDSCDVSNLVCISVLAVELLPADLNGDGIYSEGALVAHAEDFINYNMSSCDGVITYSINRKGEVPDRNQSTLAITCEDLTVVQAEVHAWDTTGVRASCDVFLDVQDNIGCCYCAPQRVQGIIQTELGYGIEGVFVQLNGFSSEDMITGVDGYFFFDNLYSQSDYSVIPQLNEDWLNGVSTFDLLLITKHILGVKTLDSPYKIIAADANWSSSITTLDIIKFRKLILGIDTNLSNVTSWRFIPANYQFSNPENPWEEDFPEAYAINNFSLPLSLDFIGVKIGDVSNNNIPNSQILDNRNAIGLFPIEVTDFEFEEGETIAVTYQAKDLVTIHAYQATLSFDKNILEFTDIKYGINKSNNFGMNNLEEGLITISWNKDNKSITNFTLFTLVFQTKTSGRLQSALGINSKITKAEAYDQSGGLWDVGLKFKPNKKEESDFELYQNWPNPFRNNTRISFYLPKAGKTRITFYDPSGKVVQTLQKNFAAGYNEVTLNGKALNEEGLLYYRLEVGDYKATKRMMIIK